MYFSTEIYMSLKCVWKVEFISWFYKLYSFIMEGLILYPLLDHSFNFYDPIL
jgi:hypothetical protein